MNGINHELQIIDILPLTEIKEPETETDKTETEIEEPEETDTKTEAADIARQS